MDRCAEGTVDAHPPITEIVAESLDDDRAIARHRTRGFRLFGEILHDVARGKVIETMTADEFVVRACSIPFADGANELSECATEFEWSARSVAVPERHLALLARCGAHRHTVEGDVLDPPRARTENERLAWSRLVHHLFVEFADACAVGQEHAEQSTIGDRSAVRHRKSLRTFACPQRVLDAVPHEARLQFGELLARVATAQEIEHVGEHVVGEVGEVRTTTKQCGERTASDLRIHRHVGDDLLGEHVERVAQESSRLDLPRHHALGHDCGLQQVMAMLREHLADARLANLVSRTTDTLHSAAHRTRRLDLDHEVDGPHVDAELQTARGDERAEFPALQLVLDDHALFASERSVMSLDQLVHTTSAHASFDGELVDVGGQSLSLATRIAEDDGALVFEDEIQDLGIHTWPDARTPLGERSSRRTAAQFRRRFAEIPHVLDRDDHLHVELLAHARVDDLHLARHSVA